MTIPFHDPDGQPHSSPRRALLFLACIPTILVGIATHVHAPRPTVPPPVLAPRRTWQTDFPPRFASAPSIDGDPTSLRQLLDTYAFRGGGWYEGLDRRSYSERAMFRLAVGAVRGHLAGSDANGYLAAKRLCEQRVQRRTAHVCVSKELTDSETVGRRVPRGWFSAARLGHSAPQSNDGPGDCRRWTSALPADRGTAWSADEAMRSAACNERLPVLCCD